MSEWTVTAQPLTDVEQAMLRFEHQWWHAAGAKDVQIRNQFGMEPTRYYQQLNVLIDRPAALAFDPVVCARLQRIRTGRSARNRQARRRASA